MYPLTHGYKHPLIVPSKEGVQLFMITIDLDSSDPLFHQLVLQIKQAIGEKQLQAGDALPSIRQLAADLDINAKTVAKAYRLLERDNVIESKGYRGSFVHSKALNNLHVDINEWLGATILADIEKYRKAGATDSEIRNAFNQAMSR
jgi:GntR family transcriptional regulator